VPRGSGIRCNHVAIPPRYFLYVNGAVRAPRTRVGVRIREIDMSTWGILRITFDVSLLLASARGATGFAQALPEVYGAEVVVSATRLEERHVDRAVNVMVISAEDIRNSAAKTLSDLLGTRAAITVHDLFGNNAANATVDLRGFGVTAGQNTLILVDGRRLGDIDLSGLQWSAMPFAAIERRVL